MAASNLIIGMGGTGAKIIEAFTHLCAAGLGPDEAAVGFIDQDKANGNTRRATDTLGRYVAAHRTLHGQDSPHRVAETTAFLRTRLTPHGDPDLEAGETALKTCHWAPHAETGAKLSDLMSLDRMPDNAQNLARVLFARDATELDMVLDKGYRGRPHIGATALLYQAEGDDWWRAAEQFIREAANKSVVRIFLCGSIFGGTGAAVLPTVARRMRKIARDAKVANLRISASLMLPYFTFRQSDEAGANVVETPELLQQTKAALEYYDRLLTDDAERTFDRLYLVGWNPPFALNYHEAGAAEQENPPLGPELVAAFAACDELQAGPPSGAGGKAFVMARERGDQLSWSDVPSTLGNDAGRDTQSHIGAWLRFMMLWRNNFREALDQNKAKLFGQEAWYGKLVGGGLKRDASVPNALKAVDDYTDAGLKYAAALAAFSNATSEHGKLFRLWRSAPIATVDTDDPKAVPELKGKLGGRPGDLDDLVGLRRGQVSPPTAADIYEQMRFEKPHDGRKSLGALITALYARSALKIDDLENAS